MIGAQKTEDLALLNSKVQIPQYSTVIGIVFLSSQNLHHVLIFFCIQPRLLFRYKIVQIYWIKLVNNTPWVSINYLVLDEEVK